MLSRNLMPAISSWNILCCKSLLLFCVILDSIFHNVELYVTIDQHPIGCIWCRHRYRVECPAQLNLKARDLTSNCNAMNKTKWIEDELLQIKIILAWCILQGRIVFDDPISPDGKEIIDLGFAGWEEREQDSTRDRHEQANLYFIQFQTNSWCWRLQTNPRKKWNKLGKKM